MSRYHVGKSTERKIAKLFGTTRRWDKQSEGGCDFKTSWIAGEVFVRKIPLFLRQELGQAIADSEGKLLPIAVWHEKGTKTSKDLVVLRLEDFLSFFGS